MSGKSLLGFFKLKRSQPPPQQPPQPPPQPLPSQAAQPLVQRAGNISVRARLAEVDLNGRRDTLRDAIINVAMGGNLVQAGQLADAFEALADQGIAWKGREPAMNTARTEAKRLADLGDQPSATLLTDLDRAKQQGSTNNFQAANQTLDDAIPEVAKRTRAQPLIAKARSLVADARDSGSDLGGKRDQLAQEIVDLANADDAAQAKQKLDAFAVQVNTAVNTHLQDAFAKAKDPGQASAAQKQKIEAARQKLRDTVPKVSADADFGPAKKAMDELTKAIKDIEAEIKAIQDKRMEGDNFKTNGSSFASLNNVAGLGPDQKKKIDALVAAELAKPDAAVLAVDFRTLAQNAVDQVQRVAEFKPTFTDGSTASPALVQKFTAANTLAAKSPSMKDAMFNLQGRAANAFPVKVQPTGEGAWCSRGGVGQGIFISNNYANALNSSTILQTISHEAGHAQYTPGDASTATTKADWIDKTVREALLDEAEATMFNCKVRQEILDNGGADIGVAGQNSVAYIAAYDAFVAGTKTRDETLDEIATAFGTGETTSTTGDNYDTYYRTWATANAPGALP